MASRYSVTATFSIVVMMVMLMGRARSDMDQDRAKCADQLVGLATCLPYVGGDAKSPTLDCCTGLKGVLQKSKVCLCILIKDRDDPKLGLKIDATRALSLPQSCHAPANISECPSLLNLPANSPDAKIFEQNGNSTAPSSPPSKNTTGGGSATTAGGTDKSTSLPITSDGGRKVIINNLFMGMEMVQLGVSIMFCLAATTHSLFY